MLGVASPPTRTWQLACCFIGTVAVSACVPMSDLDGAARGSTGGASDADGGTGSTTGATSATGGAPGATGGTTGAAGGIVATGGAPVGGTNGGNSPGGDAPNGGAEGGRGGTARSGSAGVAGVAGVAGAAGVAGVAGIAGTAGDAGAGGEPGSGGTGGVLTCPDPLRDCDDDPSDCETDISSDLAHCGGCGSPCSGEYDECVASECVTPCIWETATPMDSSSYPYIVPGDGCVKITQHRAGYYYIQVNRSLEFTYVDQCGNSGGQTLQAGQASSPMPACLMTINLLGTSPDVEITWWFGG
jgi:hypothetical protein